MQSGCCLVPVLTSGLASAGVQPVRREAPLLLPGAPHLSLLEQHLTGHAWYAAVHRDFPVAAQDDDYLYLIMEYLPGGDVMVRTLPLARCRFQLPRAAEMDADAVQQGGFSC